MISVRQWGPSCYAAYVDDGGWFGEYVGNETTREAAEETARKALAAKGVCAESERLSGRLVGGPAVFPKVTAGPGPQSEAPRSESA